MKLLLLQDMNFGEVYQRNSEDFRKLNLQVSLNDKEKKLMTRSENMARIKNKDTKPEVYLRKLYGMKDSV